MSRDGALFAIQKPATAICPWSRICRFTRLTRLPRGHPFDDRNSLRLATPENGNNSMIPWEADCTEQAIRQSER
jgi:hypothetical protein